MDPLDAPHEGTSASVPGPPDGVTPAAPPTPWNLELRRAVEGIDPVAATACVVAMAVLVASHYQGGTGFFREHLASKISLLGVGDADAYLWWFWSSVLLYLVIPLIAARLTPGQGISRTGFAMGDRRFGFTAAALMLAAFLPVVTLASGLPAFASAYPLCGAIKGSPLAFVAYELSYVAYFFAWEYLFRGYLLFSLEPALGRFAAFVQMMPFAVAHLGKPESETFGSIGAGVILGLVALRARSFVYGAIVHAVVAVAMDLLASRGSLLF